MAQNYSGVPRSYGLAASMDDIPMSLGSDTAKKPIPSSYKTVGIVSSNGDQSASGFLNFQIPTGAGVGYLRPNSVYLKCRIQVAGATNGWAFGNATHSASAIIRNLTISVGNQIIENIQNYGILHDQLLLHTTSRNYLEGDSAVMELSSSGLATYATGAPGLVDVCIPLVSGLFSNVKAIPLFLLNSPIQVQIDLETVANALHTTTTASTGFTVSNSVLVYDHVAVDESYKQSVRMAMAEGRLYQLNVPQFLNGKTAKGATNTLTYNIGVNMSSVKAVLYTISVDPGDSNAGRTFIADAGGAPNYEMRDFEVLLDGQRVNNVKIDSLAMAYAEMNKCLGNLYDPTQTYALATTTATGVATNATKTSYATVGFLGGVSTNRFNEHMAMTGMPAQNIQFTLTTAGATAGTVYYFVIYDSILAIDASGNSTLIR